MSEAVASGEVLTRGELDALLASLAEERAEQERRAQAAPRLRRDVPPAGHAHASASPALRRALESFALQHGRRLSISHQRRLGVELLACNEASASDLAETFLSRDRLVTFALGPDGPEGFLLLGRPLFFSLLTLACGAHPDAPALPLPTRPYTQIEQRYLVQLSQEIVAELGRAWAALQPGPPEVRTVDPPSALREHGATSFLLASFDVTGLGEACRMRVALPTAAFARGAGDARAPTPAGARDELERLVLDTRVELRASVGAARLPLRRVQRLRVGDVIPLERVDGDGLLLSVGGVAKFRAQRGAVGKVLAIEVQERI